MSGVEWSGVAWVRGVWNADVEAGRVGMRAERGLSGWFSKRCRGWWCVRALSLLRVGSTNEKDGGC